MILRCNFEELRALASAGEAVLAAAGPDGAGAVSAPAEEIARVELLLARLTGDVSIETLTEQRAVRHAVSVLVDDLHARMDRSLVEHGPAHEEAINLFFDYGHARGVLDRLDGLGSEMEAMVDLMTGGRPGRGAEISFPD